MSKKLHTKSKAKKLITTNPYTGEKTGEFAMDNLSSAMNKLIAVKKAQPTWQQESLSTRLALVKEALQYFATHREEIGQDICESIGRPLANSLGELNGFFERANYLCSIAESTLAPDVLPEKEGFHRAIEHVPYGTIFVISAWNYPLLITVNSVVPAMLAGNTILLKHSSLTPKIGKHFENAFKKLGSHDNLLKQVIIDHNTTGKLIEDGPVDHVVFTGSVSGGHAIQKHTSKKFMTPALELGGKDAAYVHSDANIRHAVDTVVDGAMYNAGQSCCGIERVYVHESVYEEFMRKAKTLVDTYRTGDPKDSATNLGPLAQAHSVKIMEAQIKEAKAKGAKIISGGKTQKINKGTFFPATLLTVNSNKLKIMQEENFGPIMPVMKVKSLEQAIDLVNDSHYGLTSAIFTTDQSVAEKFARLANTGTVFMNRCDYLDPALPWTGVKDSGVGSTLSKYGFYSVTRNKSIHFKQKI